MAGITGQLTGYCSKVCMLAKTKRCRCHCRGKHHGLAHKTSPEGLDPYMKRDIAESS